MHGFRLQGVFDTMNLNRPYGTFVHSNSPDQQNPTSTNKECHCDLAVLGTLFFISVRSSITRGLAISC